MGGRRDWRKKAQVRNEWATLALHGCGANDDMH